MEDILNKSSELFFHNGLIIVIGCTIIGLFLKGTFKKLPNKFIPYINMVVAIGLGFVIPDTLTDKDYVTKTIELAFLGLSSTGLYEALCILVKKRFSIDIPDIVHRCFGVEEITVENTDADEAIEVVSEIVEKFEGKGENTDSTEEPVAHDEEDDSDVDDSEPEE
jgi:hypothetical protein